MFLLIVLGTELEVLGHAREEFYHSATPSSPWLCFRADSKTPGLKKKMSDFIGKAWGSAF